jgi:glycosyltransferase involved in cell wall biosynthesis
MKIVNCAFDLDPNWRWIEHRLSKDLEWKFFSTCADMSGGSAFHIQAQKFRCARECVQYVRKNECDLLVSHGPSASLRCALLTRLTNTKVNHLAFAFNFAHLPTGFSKLLFSSMTQSTSHFVVASEAERLIYHKYFDIPLEKLLFLHWGGKAPEYNPKTPIVEGEYLCAIGGNRRNYKSLVAAMEKLPQYRCVIVARPYNLAGVKLPSNVVLYENIPFEHAMNLLKFSKFMVLPLEGANIPCGHVTMVSAMRLGVPMLVSASSGITDYAIEGQTAVVYEPLSGEHLAGKITELWNDPDKLKALSSNGSKFAEEQCSERRVTEFFSDYLNRYTENFNKIET